MWVKICGVRDAAGAAMVAAIGPDAIGLNFYPQSLRFVNLAVATRIVKSLPAGIEAIGVFVNATRDHADRIGRIVDQVDLHGVQFHGDETPEDIAAVMEACPFDTKVIRSWTADEDWSRLPKYVQACRDLGVEITALLMDAHAPGQYGGTGQTVDWSALRANYDFANWPALILAGGLKPENVADAIRMVQPWGVDVASGVESSPGVKDPERVRQFVEAARAT